MRRRKNYIGFPTEGCRTIEIWLNLEYEKEEKSGATCLFFRTLDHVDVLRIIADDGHKYQMIKNKNNERFISAGVITGSPEKVCYLKLPEIGDGKYIISHRIIREGTYQCTLVQPNDPLYPPRWILSSINQYSFYGVSSNHLYYQMAKMGICSVEVLEEYPDIAKKTTYTIPYPDGTYWTNITQSITSDSWLLSATKYGYVLHIGDNYNPASDYGYKYKKEQKLGTLLEDLYAKYKSGEIGTMTTQSGETFQLTASTVLFGEPRMDEV